MRSIRTMLLLCALTGSQLVSPGGMTPYGGGGAPRQRGFGYVSDPAAGFFVAGSTVQGMLGVYERTEAPANHPEWQLAYSNVASKWWMALADNAASNGKATEWLLVDELGRKRFSHEGETVLPGCCYKWAHRERAGGEAELQPVGESQADADELPWQVIYIGDAAYVQRMQRQKRYYEETIRQATLGHRVDAGQYTALAASPGPDTSSTVPALVLPHLDVLSAPGLDLMARRDFQGAASHFESADEESPPLSTTDRSWLRAALALRRCRCLRRARKLDEAYAVLEKVLQSFPGYGDALHEAILLSMDRGDASNALAGAERLLRLDRAWPGIQDLVVATTADVERQR
ncbi:hypothetical protein M885DRAFT_596499 [Pelagophyceae sp. CCMP2097]|nr:hypothetical protein M885DRAFT_596499 [Pelagophyceae sp. CCMP2097]